MKPVHILLVEDNEGDILLTTEALAEGKTPPRISIARDGEEAIQILNKTDRQSIKDLPDLVLLDINLPKKNGYEVLHYIKTTSRLKKIPVVVLTTSSSLKDIESAYNSHANCYVTKSVEIHEFTETIAKLQEFWTEVVTLPRAN
ncbi:MAG: response regulator [Bacteroidota bacterium]|nr:response regulator [Bacteroidota bacterium]